MGICYSFKKEDNSEAPRKIRRKNSASSTIFTTEFGDFSLFNPFMKSHRLYNSRQIEDIYRISEKILGKGGYGEVRKIVHRSAKIERVVKIIYKRKNNSKMVDRIKKEISILSQLDHPNVLKIHEYFEDNHKLYIITEYLKGGELMRDWNIANKTESDLQWLIKQILTGVVYCHELGIVHRDLKPQNILYTLESSSFLKIIDFGTSIDSKEKNRSSKLAGTVIYYSFPFF